jgi:predicted helicase
MQLHLKASHAKVKEYFGALNQFGQLNISHETAVRQAFASLLDTCAHQFKWKLVQEFRLPAPRNKSVIVDGVVLDSFTLKHGFWEAKDLNDQLEKEVKKKLELGYPRNNIIFQSPERAILYQKGVRQGINEDITDANNLVDLLKTFFDYREPQHEEWEAAVAEFSTRIPEIAGAVKEIIEKEKRKNQKFVTAFETFVLLCRQAINPSLSEEAVETMLIQHLLTERIFRKVFNNPEFTRRNIIAAEIEKVIDSLTSKHFSRDAFLENLDRFYRAIEVNAENATDFSEKQSFLNTVYERFFQGFSPKEADTHGIVYTPQPIVNFMVRSVEEILKKEFGKSLGDRDVHILDPFVGTGNFIVRIMQEIQKTRLPHKYANELHCNEIMLLPYYIASMNIEHAYLEATGEYKAFEGICLVDTFELAEKQQPGLAFMTEENTARVHQQQRAPIFVVLGNPPYNVGQIDEHDLNKNRKYPELDQRVRNTYAKASNATLLTKLSDPYVRAIRWASDRIGKEGIVALVTNDSFIDQYAFDGMRKHLASDFDMIYLLDLGGNVRKNPKLSGTTHNVFGIQVGVSINLFIRKSDARKGSASISYSRCDEFWKKEQKYDFLDSLTAYRSVGWTKVVPDRKHTWLGSEEKPEFENFLKTGVRDQKGSDKVESIFLSYSYGVVTARDTWAYSFSEEAVTNNMRKLIDEYNLRAYTWRRNGRPEPVADFILSQATPIKWTRRLLRSVSENVELSFETSAVRKAIYRPFTKQQLYFHKVLNEEIYSLRDFWPKQNSRNLALWVKVGSEWPFFALAIDVTPDALPQGGSQTFPYYIFEDGRNRRENITDWALDQFRSHYEDKSITKWDIFYYTYGVLHHPMYRKLYAANLRRELPRIPYAPAFHMFAKAGRRLATLHVDYEEQKECPLERKEKLGAKLNLRVERMRLSKDKQTLVYNDFLTLGGIPKNTYDYRLGNRSALEWVIDQYQASTDKRSGITNDPNRQDDPEYILRLIGKVITVSLETVRIINTLPDLGLPKDEKAKVSTAVQ